MGPLSLQLLHFRQNWVDSPELLCVRSLRNWPVLGAWAAYKIIACQVLVAELPLELTLNCKSQAPNCPSLLPSPQLCSFTCLIFILTCLGTYLGSEYAFWTLKATQIKHSNITLRDSLISSHGCCSSPAAMPGESNPHRIQSCGNPSICGNF